MEFDEAIEEMIKASTEFKQAVETACVKLSERYTELTEKPAPPERKIDRDIYKAWYYNKLGYKGRGCIYNPNLDKDNMTICVMDHHKDDLVRLISAAPALMRAMIDAVNEGELPFETEELFRDIITHADFGRDLKD